MKRNFFLIFFIVFSLASFNLFADIHDQVMKAGIDRTKLTITYDGAYRKISYPHGDIPDHLGVCTDLIIRSYRKVGIDLQKEIHVDMLKNFHLYPSKRIWGLQKPDPNIDHRRVPNLQTYFKRFGKILPKTKKIADYSPGDLMTWMLPGNLPHIGIVSDQKSTDGQRYLIIHNIGAGPKIEDMMFDYPITGHYHYPR